MIRKGFILVLMALISINLFGEGQEEASNAESVEGSGGSGIAPLSEEPIGQRCLSMRQLRAILLIQLTSHLC